MRRLIGILVFAALAGILTVSGVALAADPELVVFVDDAALSLTLPAAAIQADFSVEVLNRDTQPWTVTLRLLDTTVNGAAAAIPGVPEPLGSAVVSARSTHEFDVTLKTGTPYVGKYAGRLVAISSAGDVARRDFAMSVATAPTATPGVGTLGAPLPAEIAFTATKLCPTPFDGLCPESDTLLGLPQISVSPDLAALIGSVPLSAPDSIAQMSVKDNRLKFSGVTEAAEYKGKITIGTGDSKQDTAVRLIATDVIVWPLLVLIVGLWCATRIEDFFKNRRPLAQLRIALETDKRQALADQKALTDWLRPQPFWPARDRQATAIYAVRGRSLLGDEANRALREFKQIESADEREKRWGVLGTERARVAKLVEDLEKLNRLARVVSYQYQRLVGRVGEGSAAATPAVKAAAAAWAGGVVPPDANFDALQTTMVSAAGFLEKLLGSVILVEDVAQIADERHASDALKKRIADLRGEILGPTTTTADVVEERNNAARALETEVRTAAVAAREDLTGYVSPQREASEVEPIAAELAPPAGLPMDRALSAELARQELLYNIAAGFFVVLSGLATLYFAKSSFGTIGDYLSVFLWGVGIGEVVKLLPRLPLLRPA
jgi:hypothetical protein